MSTAHSQQPQTLKIKRIKIENFRGIRLPLTIEFENGMSKTSALIYGRNGTGKSAFVDAWEWLLKGEISGLSMEGISTSDYPHKSCSGENSYIHVEFDHPSVAFVRSAFNKNRITTPTRTGDFNAFLALNQYPNFLRYSDLQEFVFMTKTEKYKYIARFFGLEKFTKNQADLQASLTKLKQRLTNIGYTRTQTIEAVRRIIGSSELNEENILSYINTIATKYGLAPISSFTNVVLTIGALGKIVNQNPVAAELTQWQAFLNRVNRFFPITMLTADCQALEKAFNELKKDETRITQIFLSSLYETGLHALANSREKSICPLCDQQYPGNLTEHIQAKHQDLQELNQLKTEFETRKTELIRSLEVFQQKAGIILSESTPIVLQEFNLLFADINLVIAQLPDLLKELKKELKNIPPISISSSEAVKKIDILSVLEVEMKKMVTDKINSLSQDERTKNLAADYAGITGLQTAYTNYLKSDKQKTYLDGIVASLELLLNNLTEFIQQQIQQIFSDIQANVMEYYNFIEISNTFLKNPQIKLVAGRDKAVELEIEFVDERITPAFKFMSESQVNSFGLAIFLAAVKYFNSGFKFIILDDVVNSFDAYKRPKISQLIAQKFRDFQVLLLTHDQVFSDTVQRDFPTWRRYKMTSWDYATGPRMRLTLNYTEEIIADLNDDNAVDAGATLGRYLEWTLGSICETMETPLKYKADGVYTLAEFYDPLVKRFRDKLKSGTRTHKLVQAFSEFEQGTIFRNYCVHWKNEASPFTTSEIESVFNKWMEIQNMLYCTSCKTFIAYEINGSAEYVRCSCGKLNLKADEFYS